MRIAVVYNHESKGVINLFGIPNREKYGQQSIRRILDALKAGGHQVIAVEGDKDLIDRLEEFMPRVLKGERPGMVFNLSYGIQGQARYTHVPGILEMVGIPYVGSGPLAHSLALDKAVAKMIFRQHNLPTPEFAVLSEPGFEAPDLPYPMVVKPKNEAVSFGLRVVQNEKELREAADVIFNTFGQPVLAEVFVEGREINVGLLGNNPPEALPAVEIVFGEGGPPIFTYEDKVHASGREITHICPAPLGEELTAKAHDLARQAFAALGCFDCARVDMRIDKKGRPYLLEINSLPSLGRGGSYVAAAAQVGLDFAALVNRLVEVASARYFGTPHPPQITAKTASPEDLIFTFLTERRDQIEQRVQEWTALSGRTHDPVGVRAAVKELDRQMTRVGMKRVNEFSDDRAVWTWETAKGFEGGTLLIGHIDVPLERTMTAEFFRRDPERLYGEGIGLSRAPVVMLEFALRALRHQRRLRHRPIGVLYYADEGRDCRYSAGMIRAAGAKAKDVLVLRPGNPGDRVITQRRGQRKYRLVVEGKPRRPSQVGKETEALLWFAAKLQEFAKLTSRKERIAVSAVDLKTSAFPMYVPHQLSVELLVSYLDAAKADEVEQKVREILGRDGFRWELSQVADRPPMKERRGNMRLAKALASVAAKWEIPFGQESSVWPSVAGLVPAKTAVVCGVGPVAANLYTPQEAVQRISLIQRTLLLAQFLLQRD